METDEFLWGIIMLIVLFTVGIFANLNWHIHNNKKIVQLMADQFKFNDNRFGFIEKRIKDIENDLDEHDLFFDKLVDRVAKLEEVKDG